jgi:hypothetical protein
MWTFLRVATISHRIPAECATAEPVSADLPSAAIVAFMQLLVPMIVS